MVAETDGGSMLDLDVCMLTRTRLKCLRWRFEGGNQSNIPHLNEHLANHRSTTYLAIVVYIVAHWVKHPPSTIRDLALLQRWSV
jgi:hypothetical protein